MQPTEDTGHIFIVVIDETYGGNEETWEEDREQYRRSLEIEFGGSFQDANVGPGADIPAFLTTIATTPVPLWSVMLAAFFLGKPISENLEAWGEMAKRVRDFFRKPVVMARNGASIVAIQAISKEIQDTPRTIRLQSYRVGLAFGDDDLAEMSESDEICENTATINLGYIRHIFEIEVNGQLFRVAVEGRDVTLLKI